MSLLIPLSWESARQGSMLEPRRCYNGKSTWYDLLTCNKLMMGLQHDLGPFAHSCICCKYVVEYTKYAIHVEVIDHGVSMLTVGKITLCNLPPSLYLYGESSKLRSSASKFHKGTNWYNQMRSFGRL